MNWMLNGQYIQSYTTGVSYQEVRGESWSGVVAVTHWLERFEKERERVPGWPQRPLRQSHPLTPF